MDLLYYKNDITPNKGNKNVPDFIVVATNMVWRYGIEAIKKLQVLDISTQLQRYH